VDWQLLTEKNEPKFGLRSASKVEISLGSGFFSGQPSGGTHCLNVATSHSFFLKIWRLLHIFFPKPFVHFTLEFFFVVQKLDQNKNIVCLLNI
jgi:hypothetical protein